MKKIFAPIFLLSILLTSCAAAPATLDAPTETPATEAAALAEIPLGAGYGARGAWFELYFTNPQSPLASQKTGGPDAPLVAAIDSARLSVDVAAYSLSLNSVRDALLRAHERGVRVRMVMESDNL
ncbi:MAG: hypothetical protein PHQ36_11375, partial [Anaerolineales bacterium]|nr:hypothetical protein [Anaerolineales bacterium]